MVISSWTLSFFLFLPCVSNTTPLPTTDTTPEKEGRDVGGYSNNDTVYNSWRIRQEENVNVFVCMFVLCQRPADPFTFIFLSNAYHYVQWPVNRNVCFFHIELFIDKKKNVWVTCPSSSSSELLWLILLLVMSKHLHIIRIRKRNCMKICKSANRAVE